MQKLRGAKIYGELTGYGATSDGYDMVAPSGEGAVRCMQMAMATSKNKIDYINTHGTSTPVGDITELNAVQKTFGEKFLKLVLQNLYRDIHWELHLYMKLFIV